MTSRTSIFPYPAKKCEQFLQLLRPLAGMSARCWVSLQEYLEFLQESRSMDIYSALRVSLRIPMCNPWLSVPKHA